MMMATAPTELFEIILRECARAQPHPWYPAHFAQSTGVPRDAVDAALDRLRLSGLVKFTDWMPDHGQGYQITAQGEEVLRHPRLLARLRAGDVPQIKPAAAPPTAYSRHALEGVRGENVRAALIDSSRPIITQALLAVNCLWFLVGLGDYTMRYGGSAINYLAAMPGNATDGAKIALAQEDTGALFIVDVVDRHQWWRLVSYGFLHGGLLHLGMNMYALFVLGPLLERMWGRAIFLTIYLLSCVGGGATAVVFSPTGNMVGASGAICGLLGSMATWVYLNRNYLPPHIVAAWRNNIITNVILIAIISFFPGVSLAGHAGGGLTGAIVSAPLCAARFAVGPQRWLGWIGTAAIAVVGLCLLYPATMRIAGTADMELMRQQDEMLRQMRAQLTGVDVTVSLDDVAKLKAGLLLMKAEEIAVTTGNEAADVVRSDPKDMNPAKAADFAKRFATRQAQLELYIAALQKADTSGKAGLPEAVKAGLAMFVTSADFLGKVAKVCQGGGTMTADQKQTLQSEFHAIVGLYDKYKAAWNKMAK
jgi:membrane associated rhomboid family serine protease